MMMSRARWCLSVGAVLAVASGCYQPQNGLLAEGGSHVVKLKADRVLRWEAFPRERDAWALGHENQGKIANVRYELRVWRTSADTRQDHGKGQVPVLPPLEITGLARPEWTVPADFATGVPYAWAARARFDLDGRARVTQWTGLGLTAWTPEQAVAHPSFVIEPESAAK